MLSDVPLLQGETLNVFKNKPAKGFLISALLLLFLIFMPACTGFALTCLEECITINPDGSCVIQEEFITAPFYRFLLPLDEYAKRLEKKGRVTIEEFDKGGNSHYRIRVFVEDTNEAQIGAVFRKLTRKCEKFFWDSYEYTESVAAEPESNEHSGPFERLLRKMIGVITGEITITKTIQMPGIILSATDCRSISGQTARWFFSLESRPVRISIKSKKLNWEKVMLVSSAATILVVIFSLILAKRTAGKSVVSAGRRKTGRGGES